MSLLGRLLIQVHGLHVIDRHTAPGLVHSAEIELTVSIVLLGSKPIQTHSVLFILSNSAAARLIEHSEAVPGGSIALLSRELVETRRFRLVLDKCAAERGAEHHAPELSLGILLLRPGLGERF